MDPISSSAHLGAFFLFPKSFCGKMNPMNRSSKMDPKSPALSLCPSSSRRQWMIQTGVFAGASLLSARPSYGDSSRKAHVGDGGVHLIPSPNQTLFRVRVEMEVKGNVDIATNPLVSRTSSAKLPMTSEAVFDYEERFRQTSEDATSVEGRSVTYVERFFHEAQVDSQLNRSQQKTHLRPTVQNTVVRRETLPEVFYSTEDYFTRAELDMLRIPVSSVGIDGLLPTDLVREGSTYKPDLKGVASALNLTSVDHSKIQAEVVSLTDKQAKIHFKGPLEGTVEGVPTKLRTVGKLMFDREAGVCSWLAIAIHETRDIGLAEPGFDVAATVKMIRKPISRAVGFGTPSKTDITGPIPSERMIVDLVSDQLHFAALMDRQWRMMTDVPGASMMRMIDRDRSIAQCDFRPLPDLQPGTQLTLEAFSEDVKQTLGDQLSEIVKSDQQVSPTGLRVLRVAATGSVQGIPIQWVLMHFSDDHGNRLQATFTMEANKLRHFAGADTQLANSLRLVTLPTRSTDENTEKSPELASNSSKSTRIADAIMNDSGRNEVQSISDLK